MNLFGTRYPEIDLSDATVAITGGGRGIGLATARAFAACGTRVAIGDLDPGAATAAAHSIGPRAIAFALDVTRTDSFAAFLDMASAEFGDLDILVNNAGVMPIGRFLDEPAEIGHTTIDVNLWGPIHGMRLALPGMIERGRGHIVNIASLAGKQHLPGLAVYCASKYAMVGLTATVRDEVAPTGVSVSAILPTLVRTELSSGVPLGRGLPAVDPDDVAHAVVDSVRTRNAEVTVPRWMGAAATAAQLTPSPIMALLRRASGHDRALTSLDHTARTGYVDRVAGQARLHTTPASEPTGVAETAEPTPAS